MNNLPSKAQLDKAIQENIWDYSNSLLYDLCRRNFKHNRDDIIATKVLFIGRIYAAAVERRRNKEEGINDDFYIDKVVPTFEKSDIDLFLYELKQIKTLTIDNIQRVLEIHNYLMSVLYNITKLDKRSFCSKYLHFHLPDLFFIYDSRVVSAISKYAIKLPDDLKHIPEQSDVDKEYAKFFCKCFDLKRQIKDHFKVSLTTRQLDKVLIEVANNEKRK